jgi:spore coat polysaccharide biosynthesis protein SpsF
MGNRQVTGQELFWKGEFGDKYSERNQGLAEKRKPFFSRILQLTENVRTVLECGANTGENLRSLVSLNPTLKLSGVEINRNACEILASLDGVEAHCVALQDYNTSERYDLVFTSGFLIHVPPEDLTVVFEKLYLLSNRYILLNEYFSPTPMEIDYRGHKEKLFKRDFAKELYELYETELKVVSYGFLWKKMEPAWDDTNWTLMEKTEGSSS